MSLRPAPILLVLSLCTQGAWAQDTAATPVPVAPAEVAPPALAEAVPVALNADGDTGIELPTISPAVLREARRQGPSRARPWKVADTGGSPSVLELGPQSVHVTPGTTALVEVATGHLNRIVTPFASPAVRTVAQAQTQVDGNVVYVATADEEPVTLYLSDSGNPDTAIALTLAPRRIPPREIRLVLVEAAGFTHTAAAAPNGRSAEAPRSQGSQPYVEDIVASFRAIARNRVPPGFGLRKAGGKDRVTCAQAGLTVAVGQVLEATALRIYTGVVRNTSGAEMAFEERTCSGPGAGVAAVAAWPRVQLGAGEETEVYVAMRPRDPEREARDRPSLLGRR